MPLQDGTRDKTELFKTLGVEFFQLLGGVSIARSRRHIKKYYAEEIEKIGKFPTQLDPDKLPSTHRLVRGTFI